MRIENNLESIIHIEFVTTRNKAYCVEVVPNDTVEIPPKVQTIILSKSKKLNLDNPNWMKKIDDNIKRIKQQDRATITNEVD